MAPKAPAPKGTPADHGFSFPAEWFPHRGTLISWPRPEGISFPGKYHEAIEDIAGLIKVLVTLEEVHLNVPNANYERIVRALLTARRIPLRRVVFHHIPTNEAWARDHGPAFVLRTRRGKTEAAVVDWGFNAWGGKYPPWDADDAVPTRIAEALKLPVFYPGIVMEGGAVDFNGAGTVLTTTSCLLNKNRNPHLRQGYGGQARAKTRIEKYLRDYYGQRHVVWLGEGIAGDDTDGHIDDLARFVDERTIAIGIETDQRDPNYAILQKARRALDKARDQDGRPFTILELPMPKPLAYEGQRVPATYVNFYFAGGRTTAALLVPTFGQPARDRKAIAVLQKHLPNRKVIGVDCRALIWGLGAIHCFTQQIPKY
ncbi:MAG: agmatine deiminase family protein [Acidobacteriota bacterium]|nr:agmatine deiminase family protein [Acidobacteriota bacterium]